MHPRMKERNFPHTLLEKGVSGNAGDPFSVFSGKDVFSFMEKIQDGIQSLMNELNQTVFSADSVEGIIVLFILILIVIRLFGNIRKMLGWIICFILFMEIGHAAAQTSIGDELPIFRQVFKYQFLQSVAQLFRGTSVCGWILWFQSFLNETVGKIAPFLWYVITDVIPGTAKWIYNIIMNLGNL